MENHLQDLSTKRYHQEEYKKYLSHLKEELVIWQQQQINNMETIEKAKEAIHVINQQKDTITHLHQKLDLAHEDNR